MSNYRYTLEKGSKKHICPNCNKNRFVKYVDVENNNSYINFNVGKCDRELNCGFHYSPKQYFTDNNCDYNYSNSLSNKEVVKKKEPSFIPFYTLDKYNKKTRENNFIKFLLLQFDEETVNRMIKNYFIGTKFYWNDYATIFWQVDNELKIRSGKVMLYNCLTGRRVKAKSYLPFNWVHKLEKIDKFNLSQCLFGLHLINEFPDKTIAIVESEKTAIIMSEIYSDYLWMACGSLGGIKKSLLEPIFDRRIILFPDLSKKNKKGLTAYDIWKEKAELLKSKGFKIEISTILEKNGSEIEKEEGCDIADYFIKGINQNKHKTSIPNKDKDQIVLKTKRQSILETLMLKNPELINLIKCFDLKID